MTPTQQNPPQQKQSSKQKLSSTQQTISPGIKLALEASQKALIACEKAAIEGVLHSIKNIFDDDASSTNNSDIQLLQEEVSRLDDGLFLLVVCGEYNSGKSSVINCLMGRKIVEEGPTPTTAEVSVLKYGEDVVTIGNGGIVGGVAKVLVPVDFLKDINIVDTPGTNAIDRKHEMLTKNFVPRADLVLFITSADRPFSESERVFLEGIRDWGKKVVVVVNKVDLLDEVGVRKVVDYVEDHARVLLGSRPKVLGISALKGFKGKVLEKGGGKEWKESNFGALESYITETLDSDERLRVKLDSIAAVGLTLGRKYEEVLQLSGRILKADKKALDGIKNVLDEYEVAMKQGFESHFARVDNILLEMLERSDQFLDSRLTITNFARLIYKQGVAKEYEAVVLKGTNELLEKHIRDLGEWAVERSGHVFVQASELFQKRISRREEIFPPVAPYNSLSFDENQIRQISYDPWSARRALVASLNEVAESFPSHFGGKTESLKVGNAVSVATATAFAAELGALGAIGALIQTSTFDVTGLAATSLLATAGLAVLPRKRRMLRKEIRSKVNGIRKRIENEMKANVNELVAGQVEKIGEIVEPFRRFVNGRSSVIDSQIRNLKSATEQLESVRSKLSTIRPMTKESQSQSEGIDER